MPICLNTDVQQASHQIVQLALKAGKPWGTSFPNCTLFSHFIHNPTRAYNLVGPARPWHHPLQCYTILGIFNAFSTLLKLIFYQVTYIPAIFKSVHGLSLEFPCADVTTSFWTWWLQLFKTMNTFYSSLHRPVGCHHPWQTHPGTADDRSVPQWHAVWECNNHHPDSPIYMNTTPPSCRHFQPFWQHHCSHQPAAYGHPDMTATGFPCCFSLCLLVQHAQETANICSSGGSASGWRIWRSPQVRGYRLHHPRPSGNPHGRQFCRHSS